jgi:hypothetical protein
LRRKKTIEQKIWNLNSLHQEYKDNDYEGMQRTAAMMTALEWALGAEPWELETGKNPRVLIDKTE